MKLAVAVLLALALPLAAQVGFPGGEDVPPEEAKLEGRVLRFEPATPKAGEAAVAHVELSIPRGWHIYGAVNKGTSGVLTTVVPTKGPLKAAGAVREPKPKHHEQVFKTGYKESYDYHEGPTVVLEVPVEVLGSATAGPVDVEFTVHAMLCTDATCLDDADYLVKAKLTVGEGTATPVAAEDAKLAARVVSVTPAELRRGDTVIARIEVTVPRGYHIYPAAKQKEGLPTEFKVAGDLWTVGTPVEPKPLHHRQEFEGGYVQEYDYHEGTVTFEVPLTLAGAPAPGPAVIDLSVKHMLCTFEICLDPATLPVQASVKILEGGAAPPPGPGGGNAPRAKGSLAAFLLLAVTTGLVTLITPCVFPMIPITVSFFTKQSSGSRGGTFGLAATYGLGIVISYTAIGFVVSTLLGEDGAARFSGNPWVNLAICSVFVVFAMSLFGWFELVLPGSVTDKLSAQGKSGFVGAFLLGLTFAITAFTCAAPFAASLLALAVQGERSWALLGFLVYSTTMAVPFFLLGLFPNALKALPRSGGWLNSVKVVMGFVELAAACKFLANADSAWNWQLVSRSGVLAFWVACFGAASCYLFGFFRLEHDDAKDHISVPRMLWAIVLATISLFLAGGLAGRHLGIVEAYLPLPEKHAFIVTRGGGESKVEEELDSYSKALAAGKSRGRPIFLEFTAFN